MFICPKCDARLAHSKTELGYIYNCPRCEGRSASFAVVRRAAGRDYVNALMRSVNQGAGEIGTAGCPCCAKRMIEVPAGEDEHPVLDLCTECQFIWFDHQEFEQLPSPPDAKAEQAAVHPTAREQMALADAAAVEKRAEGRAFGGSAPEEWWKWVPGFLGMPVEHEVSTLKVQPWVTWSLATIMVAVTMLTVQNLDEVVLNFGMVPAEWARLGGLTLLTSFFLHAGWLHLIGNAYFLLIFGDNVEDYLGPVRFILLVALSALAGDAAHILIDPDSTVPTVGASGGISGVITYYAMRFPRARLGIMLRYLIIFKWLHMPAYFALILWFGLQLFGVWAQVTGISNVSALAHLGGAAVGLLAWVLWRDS